MTFVPEERKLIFETTADLFRESLSIKVVASDGYTTSEDILIVYFDLVTISYIINYFLLLIGPILGAIGMLAYRILLY